MHHIVSGEGEHVVGVQRGGRVLSEDLALGQTSAAACRCRCFVGSAPVRVRSRGRLLPSSRARKLSQEQGNSSPVLYALTTLDNFTSLDTSTALGTLTAGSRAEMPEFMRASRPLMFGCFPSKGCRPTIA